MTLTFDHPDWRRNEYFKPSDQALPQTDWRPPPLSTLPSWKDAKRVSVDVECRDEDLKSMGPGVRRDRSRNYVVGIAFAIEDGPAHYLPIRHHGGDNCPEGEEAVWKYLRDQIRDFQGHILGAKLDYDGDWMEEHTGILSKNLMDVQVADPLIWELHRQNSLEVLCERHGLPGKSEDTLRHAAQAYRIDPKKELWKLPARFVGLYGETDARRPIQVMRRQEPLLAADGLSEPWAMEQKVTPLLVKIRRRGVRVDLKRVAIIEKRSLEVQLDKLARVRAMTGVALRPEDIWKADALAMALRAAGYKIPKTERKISEKTGKEIGGKDSVDKVFLDKCGEVGTLLHGAREWNKLSTTFAKQIRQHAIISGDGEARIHCQTNQMKATDEDGDNRGVAYGRTSATNPNLQQQPVRHDEFGEMWRSIFVADRDARWACSDWSQQEPRIAVHYAELLGLPGAKEFADAYRSDPAMDIHQRLADISGIARKIVKNYVNGSIYGMGDLKMCRHLKQPTERRLIRGEMKEVPGPEGRRMIDTFKGFAPWMQGLTRKAANAVDDKGYIKACDGRRFHFEKAPDGSGRYMDAHAAFNRIGQYEASRQMKMTLIAAESEGIRVQLIVHDEFDHSFTDLKVARRLKELQLTVVKYNVPMLVDLEVGESWGQLEKVKD